MLNMPNSPLPVFAWLIVLLGVAITARRYALPKPIPGIPYIKSSSRQILGDIPAMRRHIENGGTYITYLSEVMEKLKSPIAQVFIWPLGKPMVIYSDFGEAHDLLIHREAEFERAVTLANLVKGILPKHHIHLKTDDTWNTQRLIIRDLMTPSFLHNVSAPALHQSAEQLVELWRLKARMSSEKPFAANKDIYNFALDAVTAFAFGQDFEYSAIRPGLKALQSMSEKDRTAMLASSNNTDPVTFPKSQLSELLAAIIRLTETVMELHGNPLPTLTWAYVMRKPDVSRANKIKEDYLLGQLRAAVARMSHSHDDDAVAASSAVEHMVSRERALAEKDDRKPDYYSRVMIDELFGFVYAGHETTSTTLCWGVKNLADKIQAQRQLRADLHQAHKKARSEGRSPTAHEVVSTQVPWLEATIEEMLRCSNTAPSVDREALQDTQLLGHFIPKGTIVSHPCGGPSLTTPGFQVEESTRSPSSRDAGKKGSAARNTWNHDDVTQFKPERWLKTRPEDGRIEFDPRAGPQLAFGLGTRACWGKRLVYLEARILITLLVWNFEFLPCPPALSGYGAIMKTTNEPKDCYVRLRELV
ncbi:hypothetical protein E8E14_000796 [Neopestalotiopsis sp. 37M]|nr:hypothetical protein E8E14_000796 [Neopestalotiopsis sp. 37M]